MNCYEAVTYLEEQLGIAIAASTNVTGKDGDWVLEMAESPRTFVVNNYEYNLQCITDTERMRPDCDWDMDTVLNCDDLDDDNDGVLDTEEGFIYINITPTDLGLNATQTNQTATAVDISTKFSLPAGTVIISCTNAHTFGDKFYDQVALTDAQFTITSTEDALLKLRHGSSVSTSPAQDRFEVDDVNNYAFVGFLNPGFTETTHTTAPANTLEISRNGGANQGGDFSWKRKDVFTGSVTFTASSTNNDSSNRNNYFFELGFPRDTDGDGITDSFDSDSDGDACSDALEAAAAATNIQTIAGPYGTNGLANSLENDNTPTATINYTSTYTTDALDNSIMNCIPPSCNADNGTTGISMGN